MKTLLCFMLCIALITVSRISTAQVELTETGDPVYQFLKEMQVSGFLADYNSSAAPVSRKAIAGYLKQINERSGLTTSARSRLKYFMEDYQYELTGTARGQNRLISGPFRISDNKQSQLYYYTDSSVSFFAGIDGSFYFRNDSGNPDNRNDMFYGNGGVSARATLFDVVGIKLYASANYGFSSSSNSLKYVPYFFPESVGKDGFRNRKTFEPGAITETDQGRSVPQPKDTIFSPYQGYVRYATSNEWISLLVGRSASSIGFGYIDKLFLSDNAAPYD
jgi:hypothetical protein